MAWQFLETLSFYGELAWERKFKGRFAVHETQAGRTWILMPETYMNLSGDSVAELMRFHQLGAGELLAVHDEIEMGFGFFGFKMGGGLGGHNGLRSLEARLGTRDFARFRIGVGRPEHPDIADYVLSDFTREERELLALSVFPKAAVALDYCLTEGFDSALAKFPKIKALD